MAIEFVPVLLGSDINAYSMARAFHEAYGVKTIVYGMFPASVCAGSRIIDYRVREHNDRVDKVLENVTEVAREFPDKKILVLGCGDNYLNAISANLPRYPENVIAPYVSLDMLETLIHKEKFYELCDRYGIDHPATVVYHKGMGHAFELPFDGPFVVKPAESDTYWKHPFPTQKKAYILQTRAEVDAVIDQIYGAGYEDALILQDFIPGDDSFMRVVTNYSGADGKVRLMCVGHVLLEEHTGHAIGNQHWPAVVKGTKVYVPLTVDKKVMLSVMETHHIEDITYRFIEGTEVIPYLAPHEVRRLFGGAGHESHSHEHVHGRIVTHDHGDGHVHTHVVGDYDGEQYPVC